MAASDRGLRIIKRWRELGGNSVVFDVKDSDGSVNFPFDHPLAGGHHIAIPGLPKFTHFLHSQGMHAINEWPSFATSGWWLPILSWR